MFIKACNETSFRALTSMLCVAQTHNGNISATCCLSSTIFLFTAAALTYCYLLPSCSVCNAAVQVRISGWLKHAYVLRSTVGLEVCAKTRRDRKRDGCCCCWGKLKASSKIVSEVRILFCTFCTFSLRNLRILCRGNMLICSYVPEQALFPAQPSFNYLSYVEKQPKLIKTLNQINQASKQTNKKF